VGAYLGAILMVRAPLARYLLPVSPALILFLASGVRLLGRGVKARPAAVTGAVLAGACVLVACNLPKDFRLVYRTHHPDRIALEGNTHVFRAGQFLRASACEGGRFVSSQNDSVLSYLSGMSYLAIGPDLWSKQPPAKEVLGYLDREDVACVVIWPNARRMAPFHAAIGEAVLGSPEYRRAFGDGEFWILCRATRASQEFVSSGVGRRDSLR
jgi:hypothetical protein